MVLHLTWAVAAHHLPELLELSKREVSILMCHPVQDIKVKVSVQSTLLLTSLSSRERDREGDTCNLAALHKIARLVDQWNWQMTNWPSFCNTLETWD